MSVRYLINLGIITAAAILTGVELHSPALAMCLWLIGGDVNDIRMMLIEQTKLNGKEGK